MVRLSANVNKIATLRNSRGGAVPDVGRGVRTCLEAGAPGITVHPRADQRHITPADVHAIAAVLADVRPGVEFNIEGDPRPDLLELAHAIVPDQLTLVPVRPGEVTSQAGWSTETTALRPVIADAQRAGIRVSLFVDPTPEAIRWAASLEADRIELFTEPYAQAFARGHDPGQRSFETYAQMAQLAHTEGLGINAGHDLDLDNLPLFCQLPFLDEVSIGHALIAQALFDGLDPVIRRYLAITQAAATEARPRSP